MNPPASSADQEGVKTPADATDGNIETTPAPSGQDANTTPSGDDDKTQEQTIPMSRFREVIEEKNKYKDELAKRQKAEEKQRQKELEEQGKYQELLAEKDKELETASQSQEQLTAYEETLGEIVEQELEKIPKEKRSLIPDELSLVAKPKYITKNREWLLGEQGSTGAPIPPNYKNLSDFEAKKQRYEELMTRQAKGEFLTEAERREIMKLGGEIVVLRAQQ